MKIKTKLALVAIIVLAFFLRAYKIDQVPPSLNWDEVSIGYNSYSILKTGKDEWGKLMPLHFRAFGEYKLPMQIYLSVPGIWMFGLNEVGVRITPIIYGTITVLLTFFLSKEIFKNRNAALVSAFLLAISPWHIQLTRASLESSLAMGLVVAGLLFFLKGLSKDKYLYLSAVFFGLSIYTYNAERVFSPLFLLYLFFIFRTKIFSKKRLKKTIIAGLVFSFFVLRLAPTFFNNEAQSRYKLVSLLDDSGFVLRINEARGELDLPKPIPRLVHNKLTHFGWQFGSNFVAHFSADFLFVNGASHHQHHVQGIGQLYYIEAPLLLAGLYFLFKKTKGQTKKMFVGWIFLAAIPVSITFDSIPHGLRNLLVLPSYQLLSGFGFICLVDFLNRKKSWLKYGFIGLCSAVLVIQFFHYLRLYFVDYPVKYSQDWQYGYKQVMEYVSQNQDQYDRVIITRHFGEPHIFTLFWLKYSPEKYQNSENLVRFQSHDWVWVTQFDKYIFPDLGDPGTAVDDFKSQYQGKGKTLIVGRAGDFSSTDPVLLKISFLNGDDAFVISEF
jgi:4-amino-4-deoxy-L-arabinose transferase-like glycosyltransferase